MIFSKRVDNAVANIDHEALARAAAEYLIARVKWLGTNCQGDEPKPDLALDGTDLHAKVGLVGGITFDDALALERSLDLAAQQIYDARGQ